MGLKVIERAVCLKVVLALWIMFGIPVRSPCADDSDSPAIHFLDQIPYQLKRWHVIEEMDSVTEVIRLYAGRPVPAFMRRFWLINKPERGRRVLLEFASPSLSERLVFSPDEDYVYYLSFSEAGRHRIQGVSLLTESLIDFEPADRFSMVICPDEKLYIIALKEGAEENISQYEADGSLSRTFAYSGRFEEIDKEVCYPDTSL